MTAWFCCFVLYAAGFSILAEGYDSMGKKGVAAAITLVLWPVMGVLIFVSQFSRWIKENIE
jgi:hypothetical protein